MPKLGVWCLLAVVWCLFAAVLTACSGVASSNAGDRSGRADIDGGIANDDASNGAQPSQVRTCMTNLAPQLEALGVPGLSAGIVKNGRLVCTAVAGMANMEKKQAVTPDTLFLWASVSKTVTATALLRLFDQRKFELDDDINRFLPFRVEIPSCAGTPITFRQLLTHSSSIVDNDKIIDSLQVKGADSPVALLDFMKGYLTKGGMYYDRSANFHAGCPGTFNSYSNIGATLIGALAQVISGTPLEQLTRHDIFTPLGMNETSWRLADLEPDHLAMPYARSKSGFHAFGQYGEADWPDGMLRTSVPQIANFLLMNIELGQLRGQNVLTRATLEEARRPQTPELDPDQGLIWYWTSFGPSSKRVFGHNGSDDGASSNMFFDPATGAGVILVANGDWNDANDDSPAADALMDKLFDEAKQY